MFDIRFSKVAGKYLKKLDQITKERIKKTLLELAENPYKAKHLDVKKLANYEDAYRLKIGKYRAMYKIINKEVGIFIKRSEPCSPFCTPFQVILLELFCRSFLFQLNPYCSHSFHLCMGSQITY